MGRILIRQLDDSAIERLKQRARSQGTSLEALGPAEKVQAVREMRAKYAAAVIPGTTQTQGVDLIREDRGR